MPSGFAFQPDLFAAYQAEVKKVVGEYQTIVGQLEEARITGEEKTNRLLGAPEALGPSGPPVDFTNSSRTLLDNYDMLLGALQRVHSAVTAQFVYMDQELAATRGTYLQIEADHAAVFQKLLGDRPLDGS
jgi:hypothetical protein